MKLVLRAIFLLLLAIGGTILWMLSHEDRYIYFPEREIVQTPAGVGLSFRDIWFTTADGVKLHGWYMPHAHARYTLLHLHGNAGNISQRLAQYRRWHAMGLSVFAFDYRGYGASEGTPSEEGLHSDAVAAWSLLQNPGYAAADNIIIAGRSLGCAVAARLAGEVNPVGLALEAPFTSLPDMAEAAYPWLPLRHFVRSRLDTEAAVRGQHAPLLLISAADDEIIPHEMADQIFAAANPPKLRGNLAGGHNDFDVKSESRYFTLWLQWLNKLPEKQSAPGQWVSREPNTLL